MHKLTKELVDDSSFEFLSSYLDIDLGTETNEQIKNGQRYIIINIYIK